ncbi:MAG TPA: LuxR C-terminal-related transcriptional regulator [Ktedonobacteraceae bacterium]|nr:LuxR C-terminal-related transcriptional regulator [Ktedonobacteraceae bacterium]
MTERLEEQSLDNSRPVRENLPAQLTMFIGREREVSALRAMLQQPEVRLVTLTGVGGVGKTRLGLKIAAELLDEFPDGVFYVSLASISDHGLVIPTIAETLGIREVGDQWAIAYTRIEQADVVFMRGDAVTARKLTEESLSISIDLGYMSVIAYGLEHLAEISAAMDEPVRAAPLWGTEEALRDGEIASGSFLPNMLSIQHESYMRSMADVRSRLGEEAFDRAWAEGRAMTPAQALGAQESVPTRESAPAKQSSKHPIKSRSSLSNELTEREAEVLRLVARGLTNEQVAEQLFISPRTVNSHLTSVYAKIGVSSRSGATRYAIENKLV